MLDEYTALSLVVFTNTMNYIIEISISATELFDPEIYAICNFVFEMGLSFPFTLPRLSQALDFVWRNKEKIDPFKDKVTDRVNLRIKELSGGNTNFNYVVHCVGEDNKRQGSVFIKHAKAYAKG
jgi:hypothetical protein